MTNEASPPISVFYLKLQPQPLHCQKYKKTGSKRITQLHVMCSFAMGTKVAYCKPICEIPEILKGHNDLTQN